MNSNSVRGSVAHGRVMGFARGFWMLIAVAIASTACGTNYIYSAQRDQQGQAAMKAVSETNLLGTVEAVEKRFAGLTEFEADAAKKRHAVIRELEIRQVAFADQPVNTWMKQLDDRLQEVTGSAGGTSWKDVLAKSKDLQLQRRLVDERRNVFVELTGTTLPSCDDALASEAPIALPAMLSQTEKEEAQGIYRRYRTACRPFVEAQRANNAALNAAVGAGSRLGIAVAQLRADQAERTAAQEELARAKALLKAAIERYAREAAATSTGGAASKDQVEQALKKLRESVDAIGKEQGAVGKEAVADERLKQIDEVLVGLTGGETDSAKWGEGLKKAVAVAGTLPSLADEAKRALVDAKRPRLVPYALSRDQQQLLVTGATNVEAIRARRVEAATRIVEAYTSEIDTLVDVKEKVGRRQWQSLPIEDLNTLPPRERRELYELLGVYFDEIPRLQTEERVNEYRRLATFQEESTESSKQAALMWQSLMNGMATSLAGYHASGVKPETIAEFLKAIGLILIGAGLL